jgi:hypothetical protein
MLQCPMPYSFLDLLCLGQTALFTVPWIPHSNDYWCWLWLPFWIWEFLFAFGKCQLCDGVKYGMCTQGWWSSAWLLTACDLCLSETELPTGSGWSHPPAMSTQNHACVVNVTAGHYSTQIRRDKWPTGLPTLNIEKKLTIPMIALWISSLYCV